MYVHDAPLLHTHTYTHSLSFSIFTLNFAHQICVMSNWIGTDTEQTVWFLYVCFDFCLGKHFKQYRLICLFVRLYQKLELDIIKISMLVLFYPFVCPFFRHSISPSHSLLSCFFLLLFSLFWSRLHSMYQANIPQSKVIALLVCLLLLLLLLFWPIFSMFEIVRIDVW